MMTREEAIKLLKQYQGYDPMFPDGETLKHAFDLTDETVDTLLTALRPASREQVEKVWRGEWNNINPAVLKPGVSWVCRCAKCGCPQDYKHNFCPNCGAAQTDEAVQILIERMEELKHES